MHRDLSVVEAARIHLTISGILSLLDKSDPFDQPSAMDNKLRPLDFAGKFAFETWNMREGVGHITDTTLRLESPGSCSLYSSNLSGLKRKWGDIGRKEGLDYTSLALGLWRSSSSSDSSTRSSATLCTRSSVKETDDESVDLGLDFQLHLGNQSTDTTSKATNNGPMLDLQLSLSVGTSESVITSTTPVHAQHRQSFQTSAEPLHHLNTTDEASGFLSNTRPLTRADPIPIPELSSVTQKREANTKHCQFQGCAKGARGASRFCIAHGGGRRCQKDGCQKGAEGRTIYCKAHGGGRRCEHLGCTKSAEGRTDFCIAHGGGRRCRHEACTRAARGKSGLCIRHGGGKRCQRENCTKSAEGHSGLCISHGGGRRCQHHECSKGAQGGTMFCKAHGGGKRCMFSGCDKGAEGSTPFCKGHGGGKRCAFQNGCGKSVHGGTQFCVAHGGGKRCSAPDCTKSARGRSEFCVRHGGGKRCKSDGCGKSAQGSTDYCKAHGGGRRCSWCQAEGIGGQCDRFARGKTGLCAAHGALVQDQCVHGGALHGTITTQNPIASKSEKMKGITFEEDVYFNIGNGRQSPVGWNNMYHMTPIQASMVSLPEGRVHGGSLLAMMAAGLSIGDHSGNRVGGGTSEQHSLYKTVHDWV